jgi:hypothetical protein
LVFSVSSLHPFAVKSHLIKGKDAPITKEIPKDQEQCGKGQVKDYISEQKILLQALFVHKSQGF